MRVLIFGSTAHLTFNITRLAIGLKKVGLEITVASTKREEQPGLIAELASNSINWYEINEVDKIFSLKLLMTLVKIIKILKNSKTDIIHCNCFRHLILVWIASRILQCNVKLFVTIHTTLHGSKFESLIIWIEKLIILLTNSRVITVCNYTRTKFINAGIPPQKITTIPNSVDLYYFDKSVTIKSKKIKKNSHYLSIINVGALIPRKGHKYLIEAAKLCKENNIQVYFRIVGEGSLRPKLMKMIREYQLEDRIFLMGRILKYSELYRILNESDIFVFPSKAELLPFAVLEAMAARKPVIATDVGGINEIIHDHINGILISSFNQKSLPREIYCRILELYKNRHLAIELGEHARKTIEEKFSMKVVVMQLKNEYEKVVNK
ncbi:MAG: glycosyltransferase family 4 protein [Candidatus Bathyarchaeia archaeon]